MLAYIAPLWIVGVVCLAASVVGTSLKLGGAEIPALPSPATRLAIALIGVLAIVLGLALFLQGSSSSGSSGNPRASSDDPPGGHSPGPPATTDPPASTPPSPSPSTTSPPTPPPSPSSSQPTPDPDPPDPVPPVPTLTPVVRWRGTLALDGERMVTGWFLDPVPPSRAPLGDLGLSCDLTCYPNELVGNAIVGWNAGSTPKKQQCADLLNSQLGERRLDVQVGSVACFGTTDGRVGYFRVSSMPGRQQMKLEVTVWQRQ